jgi:pimeloyl-ACP methyl ester carboxylesterase
MEHPPPRGPDREGRRNGLAYTLWLPEAVAPPWAGIVVLHGAGSRKENHADFARLAAAGGWAALSFDARGHGASEGEMSPRALDDVLAMARVLAATEGVDPSRIAVRGSSMGGFFAIHAAAIAPEIAGVIAICPASEEQLRRGLRRDELEMRVSDRAALDAWLSELDLRDAVQRLDGKPIFLLHAEGDESIPSDWSLELHELAGEPRKLVLVPGGDHRSVQHDPELQGIALRWLERQLA